MSRSTASVIPVAVAAAALSVSSRADAPHIYAIRGARIVTASGAPISNGTLVMRDGFIEAVGSTIDVPDEARIIDGAGLSVYPGLIDLNNAAAANVPSEEQPKHLDTTEKLERWKRSLILRPQLEAAEYLEVDSPDLEKFAATGVTTVLAVPNGDVFKGRSALVNVVAPEEDPQIGAVADRRRGLMVLRAPVALHVEFTRSPRPRNIYPASLMGTIAFVRQAFLDARHHRDALEHYARARGAGVARPLYDPAFDALQPALAGRLAVAFEADEAREVLRALRIADEFKLNPVITGGLEADQVVADLKARSARVIYSLNYPARPRTLAPEADEPVRVLRQRANAAKTPAALEKAHVLFGFGSDGLKEPRNFLKNARKAVREGLPTDAAVRALTIDAATIAGVADRLGSIEPGKIANLLVTDGDLFDDEMTVRHVFIDGREIAVKAEGAEAEGRKR